ncbi:histidine kinase [Terrimonas sp. NA20]|uniref:Histidine kinase n=1 Tax=Terrimonas ginsenosidimutans TaxID=2908004 RepID=A0ABS9KPS8_9BACT|nr:histidine kinase [Terrimonas ginsenosidimutans]MCG2614311.1 histidine kinase [Terrimonas ginsenosidimutans]
MPYYWSILQEFMATRKDTFLNNKYRRILFIVSAFFLSYLISFILDPYAYFWQVYFERSLSDMILEWTITLVFCILVSEASIRIGNKLNDHLPWTERPGRRLIAEAGFNMLAVFIIIGIISVVCYFFPPDDRLFTIRPNYIIERNRGMLQWVVVSSMIAFMMIAINTGNYLIVNWKNTAIKAAELNEVAMEAELQALKLQIDPHFVFNNLSVLSELILESQQLGYEYAENFSKIYRYMLVSSRKNTTLLEDELKFLDAYMFLIKNRIGEGVIFEINVSADSRNLYMPPLTLQLLVENALKHNKTSKKDPLRIRIYTTEKNELVVENALRPIEKPLDSSGIGIRNIVRRYDLLSQRQPEIYKDENIFQVTIPLIKA